jgi:hypothetical protein
MVRMRQMAAPPDMTAMSAMWKANSPSCAKALRTTATKVMRPKMAMSGTGRAPRMCAGQACRRIG